MVAVTTQVAAAAALRAVSEIEQPVPVTVYVTAPSPEPPDVVNVIGVPTTPAVVVLEIVSLACAPRKVKFLVAEVALA